MRYLLWFFIVSTTLLSADARLVLEPQTTYYSRFSVDSYIDRDANLTFEALRQQTFTPLSSNFSLGYQRGAALWLRVRIDNQSDRERFILSVGESFYEHADLYYQTDAQERFETKKVGVFTPLEAREIHSSKLSHLITLPPHETTTLYIYLKGRYAYYADITLASADRYGYSSVIDASSIYIFSYGVLSIIVVFSLFLFWRLRERIYGYYFLYAFFNLLYTLNISGLLVYVGLGEYLYRWHYTSIFMVAFLVLFSMEYLETKTYLPRMHTLLVWLVAPLFLIGIFSIFQYEPWNQVIGNAAMLVCFILLGAALRIYMMGHARSRFYILALMLYLFGGIIWAFMFKGMLEYTFWTRYAFFMVVPIEVTLFTLMLADRHYEMKERTIAVQKELLDEKNAYQSRLEHEVSEQTGHLSTLLQERELLLREVNHRVKNNFHMLIGILWMQDKKSKQNENKELINRIQSLSRLHETLYNAPDLSHIDAKRYLEEIVQNVHAAYRREGLGVTHEIETVKLNFDQALSLGIILNELLTNTYVHNSARHVLSITISLRQDAEQVLFTYDDNGSGFEIEGTHEGLGLKIIKQFCDKLSCMHYRFEGARGVHVHFVFQAVHHGVA